MTPYEVEYGKWVSRLRSQARYGNAKERAEAKQTLRELESKNLTRPVLPCMHIDRKTV